MSLQVIGAGVGRTGTNSLQVALQQLLGGPCYHMVEVFGRPDHVPMWRAAVDGDMPDWEVLFEGYVAEVDWPASAFWRPLSEKYPDAPVLLSTRDSAEQWWHSADRTIFEIFKMENAPMPPDWFDMVTALFHTTFADPLDKDACMAAYERHNAEVRATIGPDRLIDWKPEDGWAPICERLGVGVPAEPFPVTNTTPEFRQMLGLEA
ncbi:MAG: hypothetical protein QOJ09_557 [Actinomycetota bacterium]|nr:hypothetical protein [Actinomycetota bacterium]